MKEQWGEWYRGILFVMTWEMKDESGKGMFFIIIWSLLTSLFANGSSSC